MKRSFRALALAALFAIAGASFSHIAGAQAPRALQPHANEQVLRRVHAVGDQIYSCKMDGAQFAWILKGPEAQLYDKGGKIFGKHFAGPSWKANDGSQVTGEAVANAPSPDARSIPWMLFTVVSHSGTGVLAPVTSIQRLDTKGGKAPASGCDAAHAGSELRAHYSVDYVFFVPRPQR